MLSIPVMFFSKKPDPSAPDRPMIALMQRLQGAIGSPPRPVIAFIAARGGEGTTSLAERYARTLSMELQQDVLLLDAGPAPKRSRRNAPPEVGIVDLLREGRSSQEAVKPLEGRVSIARWVGEEKNRGMSGQIVRDDAFWQGLRQRFSAIVIDAASLQASYDSVLLAAKADAAVVVIEAEKTPAAVVRHLRDTLTGAGATVAGVVMNKRRFYIPNRVYRKL